MAPRTPRLLVPVAAALLILLAAAPADASVLGPREAHSPNADDIRTAYWVTIVVATVIAVAIHAALIAAIVRFRAERGREPARFEAGHGVFTRAAVPLVLIAAAVFVFGVVKTADVRHVPSAEQSTQSAAGALTAQVGVDDIPIATELEGETTASGEPPIAAEPPAGAPLSINAVGQQWLWRFEYPEGNQTGPPYDVFSFNELVVPVNTTVILNVTATDVTHRWFVPALGGQVDAVPGQVTQTWFRADREGVYPGQSTAFSGPAYAAMRAWVKVVSPNEYSQFVARKRDEIADAQSIVQRQIEGQATVGGETLP